MQMIVLPPFFGLFKRLNDKKQIGLVGGNESPPTEPLSFAFAHSPRRDGKLGLKGLLLAGRGAGTFAPCCSWVDALCTQGYV